MVDRRSGVARMDGLGGVVSLGEGAVRCLIREVVMRSRDAELLRMLVDRKSSLDFSFRRRGRVANLSPVGDLASRLMGPILVLMMRCSGVEDPAQTVGLADIGVVPLALIVGHRPSSIVGVAAGVRREMEGVRVLFERCSDGSGFAPEGSESGLGGRLSGVERAEVVAVPFFIGGGIALSRDRALSRDVSSTGGEAAATFDWNAARDAEAALDLERATEFSSFFPIDF